MILLSVVFAVLCAVAPDFETVDPFYRKDFKLLLTLHSSSPLEF